MSAVLWTAAAVVTVWAVAELVVAFNQRPRPVRDVDGRWRAPHRATNGRGRT